MNKQTKATKKLSIKNAAAITALTAGLFAGSMGIASAATSSSNATTAAVTHAFHGDKGGHGGPGGPGGPGGHAHFTVTAIGNGTLAVKDPMGTSLTVTTTSSTTYAKDGVATSVSALAVGEHVDIEPVMPSSGTPPTPGSALTAASINIESPRVGGKVVSVDTSTGTIVVSDEQGFYRTIATTSSTTYTKDGATSTAASVNVGERVEATGAIDANHTTLDASSVHVGKPAAPAGAAPAQGMPGGPGGFN